MASACGQCALATQHTLRPMAGKPSKSEMPRPLHLGNGNVRRWHVRQQRPARSGPSQPAAHIRELGVTPAIGPTLACGHHLRRGAKRSLARVPDRAQVGTPEHRIGQDERHFMLRRMRHLDRQHGLSPQSLGPFGPATHHVQQRPWLRCRDCEPRPGCSVVRRAVAAAATSRTNASKSSIAPPRTGVTSSRVGAVVRPGGYRPASTASAASTGPVV